MRRLIANLQQLEPGIDAEQITDILWLAQQMALNPPSPQGDTSDQPTTTGVVIPEDEARNPSTSTQYEAQSGTVSVATTEALSLSQSTQPSMGPAIRLAAAKSLRKSIELERALRPLKQKVPSRSRQVLDEVATAEQIAETRMQMPVVRAEPQRWLDLALVVEETSLTEIWHKMIDEFQWLLEHLGAFRDVRVWTMRRNQTGNLELFPRHRRFSSQPRSHNPKELKDPSGQRLILVLSDCTSVSWWEGKVHTWFVEWAKVNLVTVVQLLPQRLWNRGVLGKGLAVQLRTSVPGAPNPLWQVERLPVWWTLEQLENLKVAVTLPVVTLEPAALGQWARAVSGLGEFATTGVLFKKDWQPSTIPSKPTQSQPEAAKQVVSQFQATASPLARRLAILMAAAPVNLHVVELIQETMVPNSRQVHVAEVYLGGLLMRQVDAAGKSHYQFKPGVRRELRKSLAQSEALLVLNKVSAYVGTRLGREIQSFTALLLEDLPDLPDGEVLSFAEIALDVLRQMGEQYASFADVVVKHRATRNPQQPQPGEPGLFKSFEFEVVTVNAQGQITNREQRQAQYYDEDLGNGITLEMVAIPGGKFMMGSPEGEGYDRERPQHEVTVQPFYMGKYPVTQAQWRKVAALPKIDRDLKPDPSSFKGDNRPVECVSWYDVVEFCARLSKASGKNYRLPSEAEWEYACRAGTVTPFYFGETLTSDLANYRGRETYKEEPKGEYRQQTTPVGTFPGNAFGLFDMHGNVWEWCEDLWHENYEGAPIDGEPWLKPKINQEQNENDNSRLLRGGSWDSYPDGCRSAFRYRLAPDFVNHSIGFRVVCVPPSRSL